MSALNETAPLSSLTAALNAVATHGEAMARPGRMEALGLAAKARAQAQGGDAMAQTLAMINAQFGFAAAHDRLKRNARRFIRMGVHHVETRAKFGRLADQLGPCDLDVALYRVDRWFRVERKARQIAAAFGRGNSGNVDTLRLTLLLLRFLRRKRMAAEFAVLIEGLRSPWPRLAMAAE